MGKTQRNFYNDGLRKIKSKKNRTVVRLREEDIVLGRTLDDEVTEDQYIDVMEEIYDEHYDDIEDFDKSYLVD